MEFHIEKSRISVKSQFKESKYTDGGHSLNRDFSVWNSILVTRFCTLNWDFTLNRESFNWYFTVLLSQNAWMKPVDGKKWSLLLEWINNLITWTTSLFSLSPRVWKKVCHRGEIYGAHDSRVGAAVSEWGWATSWTPSPPEYTMLISCTAMQCEGERERKKFHPFHWIWRRLFIAERNRVRNSHPFSFLPIKCLFDCEKGWKKEFTRAAGIKV